MKAKHAELVPEKVSEEEFWLQFFQSQLFHYDTLPRNNSKKSFFTDVLMKEQKCKKIGKRAMDLDKSCSV